MDRLTQADFSRPSRCSYAGRISYRSTTTAVSSPSRERIVHMHFSVAKSSDGRLSAAVRCSPCGAVWPRADADAVACRVSERPV